MLVDQMACHVLPNKRKTAKKKKNLPNSEVKRRWDSLVLPWGTRREHGVVVSNYFFSG